MAPGMKMVLPEIFMAPSLLAKRTSVTCISMMIYMLTTHIERADLNLLAPLVALLEER